MDYDRTKNRLLELLGSAAGQSRQMSDGAAAQQFESTAAALVAARFPVVVCGEFKRGKSSLVGALLRDEELCPIEIDVATNVVSAFEYGAPERIMVRMDGENVPIGRRDLAQYVTEQGNAGNARKAEFVTVATPNERLASGLVLYDTPGVGGLNAAHSALTYALLPSAAAALFVADVVEPLSAAELAFAQRALTHVDRLLVVLTRADLVADPSVIVEDTRRKLAPLLGKAESEVEVVAVSNVAYFDYLRTADPADLESSNFSALESALRELIETDRPRILVERSAAAALSTLDRLRAPLATERAACADQSKAKQEEIEAELAAAQTRLAQLSDGSAGWRKLLGRLVSDARTETEGRLSREFVRIERILTDYANDDAMLQDPDRIGRQLANEVGLSLGTVEKTLQSLVNDVCNRLADASGLEIEAADPARVATGVDAGLLPQTRELRKRSRQELGSIYGRNAMTGFGLAGMFSIPAAMTTGAGAGIAGLIAAGPIGWLIVGGSVAISIGWGAEQIKKENRMERQRAVSDAYRPYLTEIKSQAVTALTLETRRLQDELVDEFDAQLARGLAAVAASRKALADARGKTQVEATRRVLELDRDLQPLDRLDAGLRELLAADERALATAGVAGGPGSPEEAWADA